MAQSAIFVVLFVALVVSSTFLLQKWSKSTVVTSIFSPILSVVLYQAFGYMILGYMDPFFTIAIANSYVLSIVICLMVLFVLRMLSKSRGEPKVVRPEIKDKTS